MQYDSLFSVSKAIAEKMGADSTKKYDSTYSVMLEILNRIGSTGGGDASKLESVDAFPTDGVKDGDVVYLKGNEASQDGFYVATLNSDGSATWTMVADDKIGAVSTDKLPSVENAGDKLYVYRDGNNRIKLYGKIFTDEVSETPVELQKEYEGFNIQLNDTDWANYYDGGAGHNVIALNMNVPKFNNPQFYIHFTVVNDASGNKSIVPSLSHNDNFRLGENINNKYEIHNTELGEDILIAYVTVSADTKSFCIEGVNYTLAIFGWDNFSDLNLSKGITQLSRPVIRQATPILDSTGNIIEGGQKLSEKYSPFHRTEAKDVGFNFAEWNQYGQITGGHSVYQKRIWINKSKSTNDWGYLYGEYVNKFPDLMVVPTAFGTSGQVLQSAGEGNAPTWTDLIKIQKITQDAYDALETKDENVLYVITNETV